VLGEGVDVVIVCLFEVFEMMLDVVCEMYMVSGLFDEIVLGIMM